MINELSKIYTNLNEASKIAKTRPEYVHLFLAIEEALIQMNQIDIPNKFREAAE